MKQEEMNPVRVRLEPALRVALRQAAEADGRSLNGLVNKYLRQGLMLDGHQVDLAKGNAPRA